MIGELLHVNNNGDCRGCWGKSLCAVVSAYTAGNPEVDGANGIATPNVRAVGIWVDAPSHCHNGLTGDTELECIDRSGDGLGGMALRSKHPGGAQAVYADGRVQIINNNIDKLIHRAQMTVQGRESMSAP
jgi:prepilin-type processing-associated H-X9-DG protein